MTERVHMTVRGHAMLVEELKRLKTVERLKVAAELKTAREYGDITENAEYNAAKEKQAMIEARARALEDRLARAEVVKAGSNPPERVRFGTTVRLEDVGTGDEVTYTLVGEDEADVSRGLLSVTSPVARALLGKQVDDSVSVSVPAGTREYEVRQIRFED